MDPSKAPGDVTVRLEQEAGVASVTLERPERFNAFDVPTVRRLRTVVEELAADPDVAALVLTGAGERAFCAGGDVRAMAKAHEAGDAPGLFRELTAHHHPMIQALRSEDLLVVTAVNGVAAGGGLGLALAGDVRLASEAARFRAAYPALGVSPDGGATWLLPEITGRATAERMLLLDEELDADAALEAGLVHRVVPARDLLGEAQAVAGALAQGPRQALQRTKRLLQARSPTLAEHLDREREGIVASGGTLDFAEGLQAFLEGRRPRFREGSEGEDP